MWETIGLAVLAAAGLCAAAEKSPDEAKAEAARLAEQEFARYGRLTVTWRRAARLTDVRGVFPHPAAAQRVLAAAGDALLISDDGGLSWRPLPAAGRDRVSAVRHVAFQPDRVDTFYLATAEKGVWLTEDAGRSVRRIGSRQVGLASEAVARVFVWPDDARFRTLYALHGQDTPGISRSHDGGRTWSVIAGEYCVYQLFPEVTGWGGEHRTTVVAARKASPEVRGVYVCSSLEDLWIEILRDIVYTDGAAALASRSFYLATADRGLLRISPVGGQRVGPADVGGYASVSVTWGPRADKELVCAYEPKRLGLVVSLDGMKTFTTQSRGLFVGPFIKEGAHVRAAANGKRFFAAVNGSLYVGFVRTGGVSVMQARVQPPIFAYERTRYDSALLDLRQEVEGFYRVASAASAARRLLAKASAVAETFRGGDLRITARVVSPQARARSVTVDLTPLRGPADEEMLDDGLHGDGAAGDGVYGAAFVIDPRNLLPGRSGHAWPTRGGRGLSIKATGPGGTIGGAVAVLSVFDRPDELVLWDEGHGQALRIETGEVTFPQVGDDEAFSGRRCLKFHAGGRPWSVRLGSELQTHNVAGYHAMSFWVRAEPNAGELHVQLRDAPELDYSHTTKPVPIVRERLVDGGRLDGQYRHVAVRMSRLLKGGGGFLTDRLGYVIFSGDGQGPATIWIDRVCFHVNAEALRRASDPANLPSRLRRR